MRNGETTTLPPLAFTGGTKAMTLTPVVGKPKRDYAEVFVPGEESIDVGELRVTVLGSGNPWPTRAQASASVLVEVGNPERDVLVFDLGTGSLANYASLKLPVKEEWRQGDGVPRCPLHQRRCRLSSRFRRAVVCVLRRYTSVLAARARLSGR